MTPGRGRHRFVTTRWSLVLAAAGVSTGSSAALEELCETYWYPAYAYVRRLGYTADDAADLTQAFFARVLEKQFFKDARPERGRFRSFLLASLRHFTLNELDWKNARRRGGGITHVPIDFALGEDRYRREPADDLTPERIYERGGRLPCSLAPGHDSQRSARGPVVSRSSASSYHISSATSRHRMRPWPRPADRPRAPCARLCTGSSGSFGRYFARPSPRPWSGPRTWMTNYGIFCGPFHSRGD